MLLGVASLKGSPGVTTLATALCAVWPTDQRILIEVDVDGATLAPRYASVLKTEPNITSLAADCRHGIDEEAVLRQTQRLPFGFDVIVAAPAPQLTERAALQLVDRTREFATAMPDTDVIFDLGRLRPGSIATQIAHQLDGLLVCVHLTFEGVEPVFRRLPELEAIGAKTALVGIGPERVAISNFDAELRSRSDGHLSFAGAIPHDPKAASVWNAGGSGLSEKKARRVYRTGLLTSSLALASSLVAVQPLDTQSAPDAPPAAQTEEAGVSDE